VIGLLLKEVVEILQNDNITVKCDAISERCYGISDELFMPVLKKYGLSFGYHKRQWVLDEDKFEPDRNLLNEIFFGEDCKLSRPEKKHEWQIPRGFTDYSEVMDILVDIQSYSDSKNLNYFGKRMLRKVSIYILEFLEHPLDALLVDKNILIGFTKNEKGIGIEAYLADMVRTVALTLALKHNVYIPFEISSNALHDFLYKSIPESPSREIIPRNFCQVLLKALKDGDALYNEVHDTIIINKKFRVVGKFGGNFFYYVTMFLLDARKNTWNELSIEDLSISKIIHLRKIGELVIRNLSSINLLIYLKTGVNNYISLNKLDELIDKDQVFQIFKIYRFYLKLKKLSTSRYKMGGRLLAHKPNDIQSIDDLTKGNIVRWIEKFHVYAKEHKITKLQYQDTITSFLNLLINIREFFEEENIFGINEVFRFKKIDIGMNLKNYSFDEIQLSESVYHQVKDLADELDGQENIEKGTFKTDIEYADAVVRAINEYEIEEEEGTIPYFNELQKMAMLHIVADSGVRSIDVLNMPFGTLSDLKDHGVDLCILGWSKLFDRFGVVPVSKKTANLIRMCSEIRKKEFPHSLLKMPIHQRQGSKGFSPEYVMQFISINSLTKHIRRIPDKALSDQLKKVCEKAGITKVPGKSFHALRHRVAEYFFFCASYYDFEGKNDAEYKEAIVKKLLRHKNSEMTKEYYWGELTNLIAEKKLVFYKDLSDISKYTENPATKSEAEFHMKSVKQKIHKDLEGVLSSPNINKLIKLFTLPNDFVGKETILEISKNQNFSLIVEHLTKVDGNKSPVPPGAAYFGKCLNFSCPKLKEKITCVNCSDHIVTIKDVPRIIGEIIKCNATIQSIYQTYDNTTEIDHLKSLRSRVASNFDKLENELLYEPIKIMGLMQSYLAERKEESGLS
jgi:hypothetical protein